MTALSIPKVAVRSFVCQPLRDAARGAPCCFLTPWCNGRDDDETVVLIHSDHLEDGNGWGCKGSDFHGAFGCDRCHEYYSAKREPDEQQRERFQSAHEMSWRWLLENRRIQFVKRKA